MTHALVTGASGFIGGALTRTLVERGVRVTTLQRSSPPELDALTSRGVINLRGSVDDADAVLRAAEGVEVIFHVAARAGIWGAYDDYFRPNVLGTRHVLEACRRHGIPKLVHTSSPSIVHGGGSVAGLDESAPVPEHHSAPYPATKAIAEREVLAAHGTATAGGRLATVALRPHLVWGPGDANIAPRLVERAKKGRLVLVEGGRELIDATYIDSAVHAHLLAWERVGPESACGGKPYFIAQGEPAPAREIILGLLRAYGIDATPRSIPLPLARAVGTMVESTYRALRIQSEPPITRFLAEQLGTAHWYDLSAAQRDLGYVAPVTTEEGLARLAEHLRSH